MESSNIHSPLALINPLSKHNDGGRRTMGVAHMGQAVPIKHAEIQRISSMFGKKIVMESTEFVTAKASCEVLGHYELFGDSFLLIKYPEYGNLDIVEVENRREGFTPYTTHAIEGDKLKPGETISYTESDKNGIPKLGYNTNVAFMMRGDNFEDAFVVSKSFANKMTHKSTKVIDFLVNSNSFLLNLFGDDTNYRSFPTHEIDSRNNILCCSRQIDTRDFLTNLHKTKLDKLKFTDLENLMYAKGKIVSIDVLRNKESTTDKNAEFEQGSLFEAEMDKYENDTLLKIKDFISTVKSLDCKISQVLMTKLEYYNSLLNNSSTLLFNGNKYKGWFIRIKLEKETELKVGSKISNLHGTKGLITKILDDSEMPTFKNGEKVEAFVNPNTIIGRMNLAQVTEILINKIADHFYTEILNATDLESRRLLYLEFSEKVLNKKITNLKDLLSEQFFEDIISTGYLNTIVDFENSIDFVSLAKEYNINLMDDLYSPTGEKYTDKCLYGSNYYLKLKHEPEKKSTVATFGKVNEKEFLVKSTDLKKNKSLLGNAASKIGEMELTVLLMLPDGHLIKELINTRGGSRKVREKFSMKLLTDEKLSINDFKYEKHLALESIEYYLKVAGINLIPFNEK